MAMEKDEKLRYEMRKRLRELRELRGSGTELISVYIPPGSQISDTSNKLKEEYGQASNIKSKGTRKNVQEALEKIIGYLKMFRSPPENGIAIFCGNTSKVEGRPDIQLISIVPPEPVKVQMYRCDSVFMLDPLSGMLETNQAYGLIVMDGRDATLATLRGKQTQIVRRLHSLAHSKIHKGGQSARRFQRLIEEGIEEYYKRTGEAMDEAFLASGIHNIIVGGPGPAKENFLKSKPFNYQFKILGCVNIGYTDEYGVRELLDNAGGIISEQEAVKEKELIEKFMKEIGKGGLVAYGYENVMAALATSKVAQVLISESLELWRISFKCTACGKEFDVLSEKELAEQECPGCGRKARAVGKADAINELITLAEKNSAHLAFISGETTYGQQFRSGFGGVGAFLRYR
ncbi:MAG: peptide chain release factor aRF-1 [Candidatus Burarchaeum sp.]|nr:peptide chain release factor aRF-1 [Candidatus Burarchaeum sp.]MDO8339962.1 peptide chain release factor aRF-1 [Candidatus Burarchaeum sp.]